MLFACDWPVPAKINFHLISSQPASLGIPGRGRVPALQGVLATKVDEPVSCADWHDASVHHANSQVNTTNADIFLFGGMLIMIDMAPGSRHAHFRKHKNLFSPKLQKMIVLRMLPGRL